MWKELRLTSVSFARIIDSRHHSSVHGTKIFGLLFKKIMSLDDYEVGRMSGKGKFSTVYKAKRKSDNLTVALKKIAVDVMDKKDVEACMQEVALLQNVTNHPNIINYLDSFLDDHYLVIVLEWAGAGDLKRRNKNLRDLTKGSFGKFSTKLQVHCCTCIERGRCIAT
jgi:serine/threonine protein kinase